MDLYDSSKAKVRGEVTTFVLRIVKNKFLPISGFTCSLYVSETSGS